MRNYVSFSFYYFFIVAHDYGLSPASLADHNFCEAIDQLALAFSSRWVEQAAVKLYIVFFYKYRLLIFE